MQKIMAIMSEGLPQKLKCIKMGLEERGVFKLSSNSYLLPRGKYVLRERLFGRREQSNYSKGIIKVARK